MSDFDTQVGTGLWAADDLGRVVFAAGFVRVDFGVDLLDGVDFAVGTGFLVGRGVRVRLGDPVDTGFADAVAAGAAEVEVGEPAARG